MTHRFRTLLGASAAFLALAAPAAALAQTTRLKGNFSANIPGWESHKLRFTCEGENPCVGTYSAEVKFQDCNNAFYLNDRIVISGLNLSASGAIQGTVLLGGYDFDDRNTNGQCVIIASRDFTTAFSGTWDGKTGAVTFPPMDVGAGIPPLVISGTLQKDSSPVPFPMTVTSRIDAVSATARADILFRPEDVGTSGSVYTFAVAPLPLVKAAPAGEAPLVVGKTKPANGNKETPVACVLAQLNASGQLQSVSISGLQAYVSGVLSSAGQSVQVINGAATVNIAGATFYVGYGSSATAMMSGGINRSAVTVPGGQVCQPGPPQTGWWWNPAESGRGYTIEATENKLFLAAYLYDVSGRSTWYISAGPTSLDGSLYLGDLESYSGGQTLTGAFKPPGRPPAIAGQVTLAFNDATHGTLTWPGGTVPISRYEFGEGGVNAVPQANQPENGWWWNADESGRGFFIEWQAGVSFTAAFMYEADGHPVWYIAASPRGPNARVLASSWEQYANGQTLTGPYKPATQTNPNVGALRIDFSGPATGIMTLPDGRTVPLTRYRF